MKKLLLFSLLIIFNYQLLAQDIITPIKMESFGLNHHTNRDVSYFSHVDSNKNIIIIGTTERDSSFTDIITTKLNKDLEKVWQKRLSIETDLSYDIPVKSFINSNNEIYLIGRSTFNQSNENGLIFITKYDENGNVIFNRTIGNIDGSDYFDYRYLFASLNEDGSLNLVYSPKDYYRRNSFNFLKINNQGEIKNLFTLELEHDALIGQIKNEKYYFLTKELIDESNYIYTYKFYKIQDKNNVTTLEITDTEFKSYYKTSVLPDQVKMKIDKNENCYLTCHNKLDNDTKKVINLSMISNTNSLAYSINTSNSSNYYLIDSYINKKDENIIVANNLNSNSIDFIGVDEKNTLQVLKSSSNFLGTGFKKNKDDSFFITTSNENVRLFSNEMVELTSYNTSNTFELIDFSKTDNQSLVAIGTSYEKMFPESDYYTQLDMKAEKIKENEILGTYSYSGIGTSRAFQQRIIVDKENNYLVLVTEKMGPEYLGIGGANPPLNKRIIKYDSDFNLIWESAIPNHIFNLVNHGGRDIDYFIDDNNNLILNLPRAGDNYGLGYDLYKVTPNGSFEFINKSFIADKFFVNEESIFLALNRFSSAESTIVYKLDKSTGDLIEEINLGSEMILDFFTIGKDNYFYTYDDYRNNTPDVIFLYKNGIKLFTRNLRNNRGIGPYRIDDNGTLFFGTNNGSDRRINKLDTNNTYTYSNITSFIRALKTFKSGNMFLYLDNNHSLVIDNDLDIIANGEEIDSFNPFLMTWGDHILLGTATENSIRVIDEKGVVVNHFRVKGFLHNWYSQFDNQGNLIMVGQFGDRIYTFNEYGWFRGFIHNYGTLNNILSVEEIENDTILNDFIVYPNPTSGILNIKISSQNIEKVILYDISGRELKQIKNKNVVDLKGFSSGLYFIKIYTTDDKILNSKIIVSTNK